MKTLSIAGYCLLAGPHVAAEVWVPSVIGDNMVLQQGVKVPVWGKATPEEGVAVTLAEQSASAVADEAGQWTVQLGPFEAGGPHKMTITGKNTLTFSNILVGEVWVCSGQSNMQWAVAVSKDAEQEIAAADYPSIRLFQAERNPADQPRDNVNGRWVACSPETVPGFSAVGYFFGRQLHRELEVPIGLINSSWGGTAAEWWTSRPALETDPELRPILERADKAEAQGSAEAHRRPGALYNGMIAPLIPFAIRGVIWYQGESNAGRGYQYRKLFPIMIRDWRTNWGQGDFPFLFVQLGNYQQTPEQPGESAWAELREAQLMTLSLPNTGMATTIDIGEADDIHPKNKQDVGKRLALAALNIAYDRDVVYSGPIYESMEIEEDTIRLHFKHVGGGLVAKGGDLKGFAIAGADRKFVWADAEIDGDTVVVRSDQVKEPVAVRYAWADNPECNLYNEAGLPASPFRTDNWPGVTVNGR